MAAYRRETYLWVIEQRGHVLWIREGKPRTRGRIRFEELANDVAARARFDVLCAEQLAAGFSMLDADRRVEQPLDVKPPVANKRGTAKSDVAELYARLRAASPRRALDVVERFCEVAGAPCSWRLTGLDLAVAANGGAIELEARFGRGRGDNPDDYDLDGFRVDATLVALDCDDLEDGVEINVFADELRGVSAKKLVARFRRAVYALPSFALVRDLDVRSVEVERAN